MNLEQAFQSAFAHQQSGNLQKAEDIYNTILKLHPDTIEAYINLGIIFRDKGQLDEAIICYQKAINLSPNIADLHYNLGVLFHDKGQLDEAIICYQKAINLEPKLADLHYNLGDALQAKKQFDKAIVNYHRAIQLDPHMAESYNALGFCYQKKGQIDKALLYFDKAIEVNPEFAEAYYNIALYYHDGNQIDRAVVLYQKAIEHNPDFIEAHWNLSGALLLSGNFKQGWKEYEWRRKLKNHYRHTISHPVWDGSDITGKTIFLHAEQGFGDTIQFIRYAPLIAQLGAKVIVECPKELKSLLHNAEGVQHVIAIGEPMPEFDEHCPLLSLPLYFDTTLDTIPSKVPYIFVSPALSEKWRYKVEQNGSGFRIGIAWSGRLRTERERYRSCSPDLFLPLTQCEEVIVYSLQKGKAEEQSRELLNGMNIIDLTEDIHDFSDTAAFIKNLDLVISIDTAVAHLAGALGKSVWTLLPFAPDWRWLLEREDSPWYPSMRLFRQPSPGKWQQVFIRIEKELKEFIKNR